MKIAYIILAHKNPAQVKRLVSRLCEQPCEVFLHVDKAVPAGTFNSFQQAFCDFSNVHFLPRYITNWGSIRLVKATLAGIRAVLRDAPECEYAVLLSGQDYPIRPVSELATFLEKSNGASFLENFAFPVPIWNDEGGYTRIRRWHFNLPVTNAGVHRLLKRLFNRVFNTTFPKRSFPVGFQPYGGSQWWCLSRQCLEYIDTFCQSHQSFVRFFHFVRIPDEIFFHTILLNSSLKDQVQNKRLTYVDWNGPPYPRVIMLDELPALCGSEYFFARKFDTALDTTILDQIDECCQKKLEHPLFMQ